VAVGPEDGLKHESSIHCDALVSIQKALLTDFVGGLDLKQGRVLDQALGIALGLV
jgi:mRNA interferase MazF